MTESLTFTTSRTTLGSRTNAFQPTFSPLAVNDTAYYDEGPRTSNAKSHLTSSLSGSMDTSEIDAFAQGVEITNQRRYDAGLVKIWSGEPGHRLLNNRFGMDRNFFPDPGFAELDLFDPVRYLRAQEHESTLWFNIITFPIITGDNDQAENYNFNGIIEPLTIRASVAHFSIEMPFEAHTVKGMFGNGNANQLNGADQVATVHAFEPDREIVGYLDMVDMLQGHPLNGFFRYEFTNLKPFSDDRLIRNTVDASQDTGHMGGDMISALSLMTGSTDNYVSHSERSMTCGWYYDNNANVGTDSLAFGGMTY